MLTKRIIPCLDVKDGRVVKGTKFENLRDAGDPVEVAKVYERELADELVFLDITASLDKRKTVVELVRKVAERVFMPFTVGGGIRSLEDIREILKAGADKVSINTSAVENPRLVYESAKRFGSQCIVVAIDAKRVGKTWKVFTHSGKKESSWEALSWAKEVENLGAGEILLTSIDKDGTKEGYDLELIGEVSSRVNIPVIASGGAGRMEHFLEAFKVGADACLGASVFHFKEISIIKLKEFLRERGIPVRLN